MAERKKEKKNKKKTWYTKGGYVAPIIVPATPGGKLANMLKCVAEAEGAATEIKFKVVEKGGPSVENLLQKPNPTADMLSCCATKNYICLFFCKFAQM